MNANTEKASSLMKKGGYTCVLCSDNETVTRTESGIKPLLLLVDSGKDFKAFSAADKIVGKAAALLYVLLGVTEVFAEVVSEAAITVLKEHNIACEYMTLVESIRNRRNDGICPMEETVTNIGDAHEALVALKTRIRTMATT